MDKHTILYSYSKFCNALYINTNIIGSDFFSLTCRPTFVLDSNSIRVTGVVIIYCGKKVPIVVNLLNGDKANY